VCAANVTDEYRSKCLQSGMDLFSTKPVNVEQLVEALKAASLAVRAQQQQLLRSSASAPGSSPTAGSNEAAAQQPTSSPADGPADQTKGLPAAPPAPPSVPPPPEDEAVVSPCDQPD